MTNKKSFTDYDFFISTLFFFTLFDYKKCFTIFEKVE